MFLTIGSIVLIGLTSIVATVTYLSTKALTETGIAMAKSAAEHESSKAQLFLERAIFASRDLASTYAGMKQGDTAVSRDTATMVLHDTLEKTPDFAGAWTSWAPNAFDNQDSEFQGKARLGSTSSDKDGRYAPHWRREAKGFSLNVYAKPEILASLSAKTGEIITEPIFENAGGQKSLVVTIIQPILDADAKVVGAVGIEVNLTRLQQEQKEYKVMETGYVATFSNIGNYVAHPSEDRVTQPGVKFDAWLEPKLENVRKGEAFVTESYSSTLKDDVYRVASPVTIGLTGKPWMVVASVPKGTVLALAHSLRTITIVIGLIALITILGVVLLAARQIAGPVSKISEQLRLDAEHVAKASSEIAGSGQKLAEGASSQAAAIEETSASLEELSGTTKRNGDIAEQARGMSDRAKADAERGGAQMREMVDAMASIKSASDNIAKIIRTIDEIAFQTNILALNAAVEAARAGEAGAGFAVVAEEVRALAQRSAKAAKETSNQIEDALKRSQHGGTVCANVAQTFTGILNEVRELNVMVSEIAAASREQSQGIAQINRAATQLDATTQSSAALAEENAAAAEELSAQSHEIMKISHDLLVLVQGERNHSSERASDKPEATAAKTSPIRLLQPVRNKKPILRMSATVDENSFV